MAGIAAGILAWPNLKGRYKRWSSQRHLAVASAALSHGDPRHALLSARNALEKSPLDVEATRIMAKAMEALGAPEAEQWRARLDTLQPDDAENLMAMAGASLKIGDTDMAEAMLARVKPAARDSAAYHSVAAAIALGKRDAASAEAHWTEASRLEPEEKRHKLNLVNLRLESKTPGVRDAALRALQELRDQPEASLEALRVQLADALRRHEEVVARDAADALVADQRSIFADKLSRLATLRMTKDARSGPYLLELRDAALSEPAQLFALLMWMNTNDLSLMVTEWASRMPPELRSNPPVALGVAEANLKVSDWVKLHELATASTWGEMDYLRRAYDARALERLGEEAAAAGEWTKAVSAARGSPDGLERLAKFALQAKWTKRAEEILWILAALPQSPRWVLDSLWKAAFKRGETAQLQKLSSAIAKKDPKSVASRNNYVFLSLLTRTDEGNPHLTAESLHREHPGNAMIASTYALSLYQQGKAEEAVAVMAALGAEELRQPQVALYYAIFLLAVGQPEIAEGYLKRSADWPMLTEEKALLARVKEAKLKEEAPQTAVPPPASPSQKDR